MIEWLCMIVPRSGGPQDSWADHILYWRPQPLYMPLFMASFRPWEAFVYILQDPFFICLQQELVQYERFCGQLTGRKYLNVQQIIHAVYPYGKYSKLIFYKNLRNIKEYTCMHDADVFLMFLPLLYSIDIPAQGNFKNLFAWFDANMTHGHHV